MEPNEQGVFVSDAMHTLTARLNGLVLEAARGRWERVKFGEQVAKIGGEADLQADNLEHLFAHPALSDRGFQVLAYQIQELRTFAERCRNRAISWDDLESIL
jgi:hypothetical protein